MRLRRMKGLLFILAIFFYESTGAQIIRTIAGNDTMATAGTFGNSGAARNAKFIDPYGVAVDNKGNVYVSDPNDNTVRKIKPDGTIVAFAGISGNLGYSGNGGQATSAKLQYPSGLLCDRIGNVYIADAGNLVVRKVDTAGIITTIAGNHLTGSSGDGLAATSARIGSVSGLAIDTFGNLYLADGNNKVRKVNTAGIISTYAGSGLTGYTGNGGPATAAAMDGVADLALDAAGNLYIAEQNNNVIRKVTPAGIITRFAGTGALGNTGDGASDTLAKLNTPTGIKFDAAGNLYIADVGNNRIRKISTTGIITAYANTASGGQGYAGDGGPATGAKFYYPSTICFDAAGHMFIADKGPGFAGMGGGRRIREIFKVDTMHLTANPGNTVCANDTVTFTANLGSGYYYYQYKWKLNGVVVGTNASTYSLTAPHTNDKVTCSLIDTANGGLLLAVSDTVTVNVNPLLTPSVSFNSITSDTVCAGTSVTYTATAVNGGSAPIFHWQVSGVGSDTGHVFTHTPVNGDTITCTVTSNETCVTTHTASFSRVINVNALPNAGAVAGPSLVCETTPVSLTSSGTTGGTWSATNGNATVSVTGVVTAVTAGVDTIVYTVNTALCGSATATKVVTTGTLPYAGIISGASAVCPGYSISLTNGVAGGTWSLSNVVDATITATGLFTGITGGVDTAIYTVINSCGSALAVHPVTVGVSSLHDAGVISGPATVCIGAPATFSDTATGGFWLSETPAIATVSASGVVTGLAPGVATIYYMVTSGCSPDTAMKTLTVIPVLSADTITGASNICTGVTITLHDTATGGTWLSDNTSVATVDGSGIVTSILPGTAYIYYVVSNSCGTDTAVHAISVATVPNAGNITGVTFLCGNSSATLSDTTAGGVWSSSAPTIVTVSASGAITGLSSGNTTISYSVTTGCGTDVAIHGVTVNPFPTLSSAIVAPPVCSGTLFNYTPTSTTPGAIFTWVRSAIPGITNPAAGSVGDPNEILLNATGAPINVIYAFAVSAGGCSTVQNVSVLVNPIPVLSGPLSLSACSGRLFTYVPTSGAPGATYAWSRAAVTGITPSTASGTGTISETLNSTSSSAVNVVYVFDMAAAGCVNTQNLTVAVRPQGPPPPVITTKSPSWLCNGTMYQNFGTSSVPDSTVTYEWTAKDATVWAQGSGHQYSLISFPTAGMATIYLSSSVTGFSCSTKDSFMVYVDNTPNETPTVDYFDNVFSATTGMSTYQWGYDDVNTLDSTILTGETNSSYVNASPDFASKYYWVITEHYSCMQKTYYHVPTAIANVNSGIGNVVVYPNPSNGSFVVNVSSANTEQCTVTMTNVVGAVVLQQTCVTNKKIAFNLDEPAGIYLITVSTPNGKYTGKINVVK